MTNEFWSSLEELRGDPEFEERRRREFAEPLPVGEPPPEGASRRDFMKLAGFGVGAAGLAGCTPTPVKEAIPFVDHPEGVVPGESLHYATTCGGCAAGCELLVKSRDGRPIKVEGNPDSPRTAGGTCATGQATVLEVYDENRLRRPLWQGRETSWEEVDRRVAERLAAASAAGGGIALLSGPRTGPGDERLLAEWSEHFPTARHVVYEPLSVAAIRQGHGAVFGRPVVPRFHFERARAIVGLEADFLGTWIAPVEHSRGYTAGRTLEDGEMSWHGQFESRMSLTGANADRRVPVEASEVGPVAVALLSRLHRRSTGEELGPLPAGGWGGKSVPGVDPALLDEAVESLWRHRGESLVVCGVNDPALQEVVAGINLLLGNVGRTLDLESPWRARGGDEGELAELVAAMERGEIHALVVWDVNPLYAHPEGERLRRAMDNVSLVVSFADRVDETAAVADAVCPDHHFLESWGDGEPFPGHLTVSQPVAAPLWRTRAAGESLLRFMGRPEDHLTFLRESWRRRVFPRQGRHGDFESLWTAALHDGYLRLPEVEETAGNSAGPVPFPPPGLGDAIEAVLAAAVPARQTRGRGLHEVMLYEKVGPRDGSHANNPWLQELPDPISRVTWGNYAAVAPAVAERLGLEAGDVVRLAVGEDGPAVELPVLAQPGQAEATVAVALGYGRRRGGPVAEGLGEDAFPLVDAEGETLRYAVGGVRLEPTGEHRPLAATQNHHTLEGRSIVKETTLAAWRDDPAAGNHEHHELVSLWKERDKPSHAWGMAVDLNACTGCGACVVACQAENNVPVVGPEEVGRSREMHWLRIDRYYRGSPESPDTVFQPMMCQHCDHAPCETVCPVLATVHSSDGLNQQIYNRCVGTRYCANNCPYKVRRFNWFNYAGNDRFDYHMNSDLGSMVLNPDVVVRSRGVMEKCSLCIQRIQRGKLTARDAGRALADGDITTACQQACPPGAIVFGDLADPNSRVSRMAVNERFYHVLAELGIRPGVGYLTKVRHRSDVADDASHHPESA